MNHDAELKIQAFLDGELSGHEAREIADLIASDGHARALHQELAGTKKVLLENEPEYRLEETHDFYWSKIRREIQRGGDVEAKSESRFFLGWQSWWVRLSGTCAAGLLVAMIIVSSSRTGPLSELYSLAHDIESPLEDVSSISFHSDSANMTVVWVQTRMDAN